MNPLFLQKIRIDWDSVDPDSSLNGIPAIRNLEEMTFHATVTFFAGENGSGKSTLLEAVAVASGFNPEGGIRS